MQGSVTSFSPKIMGKVQNSKIGGLEFFQGVWGSGYGLGVSVCLKYI